MKVIILLCLFVLISCQQPAYGNDNQSIKYTGFYIFTWIANCAQSLHPMFQQQGYPEVLAIREAAGHCSCVVDGFRKDFTMEETQNLSYQDRQLFSQTYAQQCSGKTL